LAQNAKVLALGFTEQIMCTWTHRAHELIKFIKNRKKSIHLLSVLLQLCIKFQRQIHNNKGAVKKTNFLQIYSQKSVRHFYFLLHINYNNFNVEILYTDGVGCKEYV
jgi:hypothetical protein